MPVKKWQKFTVYDSITLSPTEAGDLNAYFEIVVPAARKRYVSEQGFLFKKLSTQSPLQILEVCNRNFRTPCIEKICRNTTGGVTAKLFLSSENLYHKKKIYLLKAWIKIPVLNHCQSFHKYPVKFSAPIVNSFWENVHYISSIFILLR